MKNSLQKFLLGCIFLSSLLTHACAEVQAPERAHKVTASDYCNFLNENAAADPDHLYDEKMGTDPETACILRLGTSGNFQYEVIEGRENFPVCYVSVLDEEKYCDGLQQIPLYFSSNALLASNQNKFFLAENNISAALSLQSHDDSNSSANELQKWSNPAVISALFLVLVGMVTERHEAIDGKLLLTHFENIDSTIGDEHPLTIRKNEDGTLTITAWTPESMAIASNATDEQRQRMNELNESMTAHATTNHQEAVAAFLEALGENTHFFSPKLQEQAAINGLVPSIIRQVLNIVNDEREFSSEHFRKAMNRNPGAARFVIKENEGRRTYRIEPQAASIDSTSQIRGENRGINSVFKSAIEALRRNPENFLIWNLHEPLSAEKLRYAFKGIDYFQEPVSKEEISQINAPEIFDWELKYAQEELNYFKSSHLRELQDLCVKIREAIQVGNQDYSLIREYKFLLWHQDYFVSRRDAFKEALENLPKDEGNKVQRKKMQEIIKTHEAIAQVGGEEKQALAQLIRDLFPEETKKLAEDAEDRLETFKSMRLFSSIEYADALDEIGRIINHARHPFRWSFYENIIPSAIDHLLNSALDQKSLTSAESPLIKALDLATKHHKALKARFGDQAGTLIVSYLRGRPQKTEGIFKSKNISITAVDPNIVTIKELQNSIDNFQAAKRKLKAAVIEIEKKGSIEKRDLDALMEVFFSSLQTPESLAFDAAFQSSLAPENMMKQWAAEIFRIAAKKRGDFNMLDYLPKNLGKRILSIEASNNLGELWAGPNYVSAATACGWESSNGLRRYRFRSEKYRGDGSHAEPGSGWQSNFDWRSDRTLDWRDNRGHWGDGHLDVEAP